MRPEAPRPDPLAPLIASLHGEGRPRVWSLVVTVFGDAVAPRGGRVATARLAEIVGRVGVGEGALRTALSRLVADGALERDRRGRASFHRLSEAAAREVARASRVIYAREEAGAWTLGTGPAPPRALALAGGAWLAREAAPAGGVAVRGALIGGEGVEPEPAHAEALARLARDLDAIAAASGSEGGLAPLDALAARTLLIHRWRRLTLRWPDLPGRSAEGSERARVAAAHRALMPASEGWLDAALPPASPGPPRGRFG